MSGTLKKKKKISHFTQINNDFLRNDKLSWKAKGLLCYLMSNSDEYEVRKKNLQNFATDGYDSTDSAFKELESNGYIKTIGTGRDKNGAFIGFDYEFDDEPSFISETQEKNEKRDSEQIEPIGISRRGLPVAAEPSRLTPDKEEQYKEEQFKEEKERSLNINAETSSADVKDLFGNEVKVANGIKSKPAKKKKESTAHPSHVEIKKYWYEEFSVGERFHPGAGKFINNIIANIESYISSMGGDTSPEKITEFFKVVCNQKILSKNSFVATAGLNVLSSPTNFKTIINSIENNGKSINQTGNRAGVTNFKFGYADPRKQQRQSDML